MIKARVERTTGIPAIILGITPANVRELRRGRPIFVDGREVGLNADFVVMFGETTQAIADEIREAAGGMAPTDVHTCCPEHAAESGVPHNPLPGMTCPDDLSGLTSP